MRRLLLSMGLAALVAFAPQAGATPPAMTVLPAVASEDGITLAQGNQAERDRRRQLRRQQRAQQRDRQRARQQRQRQNGQQRQRQRQRAQQQRQRQNAQQRQRQRQNAQQRQRQRQNAQQQRQRQRAQQPQRRTPEQRQRQRQRAEQRQRQRAAEQRQRQRQRQNVQQRQRTPEQRQRAQQRRQDGRNRNLSEAQQRRLEQRRQARREERQRQRRQDARREGRPGQRNAAEQRRAARQNELQRRRNEPRSGERARRPGETRDDWRRRMQRERRANARAREGINSQGERFRIPPAEQRRNRRENELRRLRQERREARRDNGNLRELRRERREARRDNRELRQLRRERRLRGERIDDLRARNRRAARRADRLRDRRQALRREIRRDRRWIDRASVRRDRLRAWERRQARLARRDRRAFNRGWRWFDRAERRRWRNRDIYVAGGVSFIVGASLGRLAWNASAVDTYALANGWNERVVVRPNGVRVVTVYDAYGIPIRRYREFPNGGRVVLFNNRPGWWTADSDFILDLPPPVVSIPRERYIVEPSYASVEDLYQTVTADPVQELDRTYTLNQVLANENLRDYMPRVDIDTITFPSGSAEVPDDQIAALETIGTAIEEAVKENDREVYLIEGHTDATGDDLSNLELSDRRATAVAEILTEYFEIPPENLVTQGFGEGYLKVETQGAEQANRRVTIRRITPLLSTDEAIAGYEEETAAPEDLAATEGATTTDDEADTITR